jgi:hypothetical protein
MCYDDSNSIYYLILISSFAIAIFYYFLLLKYNINTTIDRIKNIPVSTPKLIQMATKAYLSCPGV